MYICRFPRGDLRCPGLHLVKKEIINHMTPEAITQICLIVSTILQIVRTVCELAGMMNKR